MTTYGVTDGDGVVGDGLVMAEFPTMDGAVDMAKRLTVQTGRQAFVVKIIQVARYKASTTITADSVPQ